MICCNEYIDMYKSKATPFIAMDKIAAAKIKLILTVHPSVLVCCIYCMEEWMKQCVITGMISQSNT